MNKRLYIMNSRLLTHVLFWVGYVLLYTSVHADGEYPIIHYFHDEWQGLPGAMLVAYVNMYVLFPRFFLIKKYVGYCIGAVILLFAASLLNRTLTERLFEPLFYAATTTPEPIFVWYMLFKGMLWFMSPVLLFTLVVKVFQQWFTREQQHQEIIKEKLHAELNFLKAQVHPHFLFNTLNNLYSLTLQASPQAPRIVLKLSELMSYMLYDSRSNDIALSKEIEHIRNYIELEKIRYGNRLEVSLNVSGNTSEISIAPLILIPFVENAFKHGVSDETGNVWVTIDIKVKNEWLSVKVENSLSDQPAIDRENGNNGIGLWNVERRLSLLYPNNYELFRKKESGRYAVDLRIKLHESLPS